jgi:hypothetical protein
MEIVETQLRDGHPEETRRTFERLQADGFNPELARRLIGYLVVHELGQEMMGSKPFDEERYAELLRRLPEVPPPSDYGVKIFVGPKPKL